MELSSSKITSTCKSTERGDPSPALTLPLRGVYLVNGVGLVGNFTYIRQVIQVITLVVL